MADPDRCPTCNVERPAHAPEGLCPRCLMRQALRDEGAVPAADPDGCWTLDPRRPAQAVEDNGSTHDLRRGAAVRVFGDYEILKELGRGGMGVVYQARQVKLNRPVALKITKAGLLAHEDELRRFQNEVEAIAHLDHPGIVPVYEVGEHAGQKYFSMKLIEGGNLAEQLATYKDNPRAAATLVARAAEAVHHAHMRGILHRDLKPANILIDAHGHPQVTDFGLAKWVEADFEMTQTGAILGTPAFMSPEQAVGRRGTITTATDVYGLGAILYALLTGKPPFGGNSVLETLDAVRSQTPPLPRRLDARIARDLETIALKCLEKDPRRRYASAQALADDLRSWLDCRPIAARRARVDERAWLWCQRRPALAALLAATLLASVAGTVTFIAVQAKANADLRSANVREKQRFDLTMEAIKLFHGQVGDDLALKADQFKPLRDKLLQGADDFYGKLEGLFEGEPDRASRGAIGNAYFELGELTSKIGAKTAALAAHRKGLAVRRELDSGPGADAELRGNVAQSLRAVAELLSLTGNSAEALARYDEARDLLESLPLAGPGSDDRRAVLGRTYNGLGFVLEATGKTAAAMSAYQRSLEIRTRLAHDRPTVAEFRNRVATSHLGIGNLLSQTGRLDEAMESYRRALAIFQTLADDNPAGTDAQYFLAIGHLSLGKLQSQTGMPAQALESYQQALAIFQKLADDNPAVSDFQNRLAVSHNNIGNLQGDTGKPAEALESHRRALAIRQKLVDNNPAVTDFQNRLAVSHNNIGILQGDAGKPAEALASHGRALAIRQTLADDNPAITDFRIDLADSHSNIGRLLARTGEPEKALESYRQALAIQQKLADDDPTVTLFQSRLARSHTGIAMLLEQMDQPGEPLKSYPRAQVNRQRWAASQPTIPGSQTDPAGSDSAGAAVHRTLGRADEVRAGYQRAIAIGETLVRTSPNVPMYRGQLAFSVRRLGLVRLAAGDASGAAADARRAAVLYEGLPSRSAEQLYELACCHSVLAAAARQEPSGTSARDAESEAGKALDLLRRAVREGYHDPDLMANDVALDPLRDRPDFQNLMSDLAMPAHPFAP